MCWLTIDAFLHEILLSLPRFDPVAIGLLVVTALASSVAIILAFFDVDSIVRSFKGALRHDATTHA